MTRINLSPWRAELRKKREQLLLQAGVAASALLLLSMIAYQQTIAARLTYQRGRNQYISEASLALNRKILALQSVDAARRDLQGKIAVIRLLQQQRLQAVHLFNELGLTVPEDIQLTQVIQNGPALKITGIAVSNASISQYIQRLEASPWLGAPLLDIIESTQENKSALPRGKHFTLDIRLSDPSVDASTP
jgi:type IV pilus assembly protein PilN